MRIWSALALGYSSEATRGSDSSRSSTFSDESDISIGGYIPSENLDNVRVLQRDGPSTPMIPSNDDGIDDDDDERQENRLGESAKGKGRTNITDEDFARSLFAEDALVEFEEYHRRNMSMYAPSSEADLLFQRFLDEQASFNTRQMVADLAATLRPLQIGEVDNRSIRGGMHDTSIEEEVRFPTVIRPGPIVFPPPPLFTREERNDQSVICSVCRCPIEGEPVRLECGSRYDMDCLKRMFEANVDDEYRFPPRCCGQVIPLTVVEDQISKQTRDLYKAKIDEYSTPWRLYCSNAQCARFLGSRQRKAVSKTCRACKIETCALCTAPAHSSGQKCKIDKDLRKALKLGQHYGWQRCPRCRQLVERNDGCYHMSCRCGAQFCYLCAGNWGHCKCWQRKRAFVKIILFRWLHLRGDYLVNDEPAASTGNAVTRLCRRSWESVKKAVTPASSAPAPAGAIAA
ncbi:hypothetical protein ACEPAF_952 [Sanghuangporus sanghuang]